jgi:hypothetical protein
MLAVLILFFTLPEKLNAQPESTEAQPSEDILKLVPYPVTSEQDSLDFLILRPDLLKHEAVIDTTESEADLDTIITYSAEKVVFTFNPRATKLTGDAKVAYREMALDAGSIDIDWSNNMLHARGLLDTIQIDSSLGGGDSIIWIGQPELDDGQQIVNGSSLTYNLKSKRGQVIDGDTEFQDGFYHGKKIKRIDADTYNIRNGYYTTCDAEKPHYHFWARDMKMVIKDKIVARPISLFFGPTPVLIFPFAVFSTRGGRQSGIIMPTYGEGGGSGRYFKNLGYYWAPNDYYDVKGRLDFYEKFGILFKADANYAKRYVLTGGISGSLINQQRDNKVDRRWDVKFDHNHTITPTMKLIAKGNFVSDGSYVKDVSQDPNERMKQTMHSNITLSESWAGTPYSASINLNYTKELNTGVVTQSLPRVTFGRRRSTFIPLPKGGSTDDAKWYNKFYYSYSGNTELRKNTNADGISRQRGGIKHSFAFSSTPDPLFHIAFTPGASYKEVWYDEWNEYFKGTDGVVDTVKHEDLPDGFAALRTFDASLRMSTKLYGLFKPNLFSIKAIRHTLSPGLTMTYNPDFSDPKWGYYDVFTDSTGTETKYNRFAGGIYGGAPSSERRTLSISLGNLFEYKSVKGEKETKGQLFNLTTNTSYNFAADSLGWSDISSGVTIPTLGGGKTGSGYLEEFSGFTLRFDAKHSFYDLETNPLDGEKIEVNRFADNGLRLLNFALTSSFSLSASGSSSTIDTSEAPMSESINVEKDRFDREEWKPSPVPWKTSFSFRYAVGREDPDNITKTIWANMKLELQATENWKVSYNARFDFHNHRVVSGAISLYRDLHCWEGQLTWNPVGVGSGFFLKINVKSPYLQDLKVEKKERGGSIIGG